MHKCPKCGGTLRVKSKKPGGVPVLRCSGCHRKWTEKDGKLRETAQKKERYGDGQGETTQTEMADRD